VGKNKTYRDNDSFDYHLIGADLDQHKDGPIFMIVSSRIRINCCKQRVKALYMTKVSYDQATGREAPKPRRTSTRSLNDRKTTSRN
jgi:hypothetical protein